LQVFSAVSVYYPPVALPRFGACSAWRFALFGHRSQHCWTAVLGAMCVLAWPARARADVRADADAMVRMMRDLRYEEAVGRGLHALREAHPDEQEGLSEIYRLLGTAYFLLGDETHARGAWVQLFANDPDAKPPEDSSPKLRQNFERVRLEAAAVALDPAPLKEIPEGQPFVLETKLAGSAPHVDRVYVHFRTEGAGAYVSRRLERANGRLTTTVPGLVLADGSTRAFEYWIEARDAQGTPVAEAGTEAAPLRAKIIPHRRAVTRPEKPPPPPEEIPVYKKWWFWGILGLAASGAGAAIYFGTQGGGSGPPSPGFEVCVGFQNAPCPPR
jgi:hypothetical protein